MFDFLWEAIGNLEERSPRQSCKYVVLQTCLHFAKLAVFFGNDASRNAVRYLERYPKSAEVGSCFRTLKSMEESIQNSV